MIEWKKLTEISQLQEVIQLSLTNPCLIFKHSTRCSISSMALNRLERSATGGFTKLSSFFLDLIAYRHISNEAAKLFQVEHQSPQIIVINKGQVAMHASHNAIAASEILASVSG